MRTVKISGKVAENIQFLKENGGVSGVKKLVMIDSLTGLKNRRAFDIDIENEIETYSRGLINGTPKKMHMVMIDLNNFGQINNNYGHTVGDEALTAVGKTIMNGIRSSDKAYRYGGDEMVLLLSDTDNPNAVVSRIANGIENIKLVSEKGERVGLSISFGYVSISEVGNRLLKNPKKFAKKMKDMADARMYTQKEESDHGRIKEVKSLVRSD